MQEILTSKSLDIHLKTKVLNPDGDFKKIKFDKYYKGINESDSHTLIIEYLANQILADEKLISNNW